jgi:aminoglycoside 3-N-acetyltransferase
VRAQLYHVMRKALSQEDRNRIKRRLAHARKRMAPAYRLRYGTFGAEELCAQIARRIAPDTEILMVHCSVNDLEPMYTGSVSELLDALVAVCGPSRTLAMPAFFFGGGEGDAAAYYRAKPVFAARRTPSQMGLLSEVFRRRAGVRRSLHPTHSVCALGPLAEELVHDHHLAPTSFGAGTPFGVMAAHKTAIVGIGTQYFRCLTQVHAAEDLLGERYPLPLRGETIEVSLKDVDGTAHDYGLRLTEPGFSRRLELVERLLGPDELTRWRFHGVPLFSTTAAGVTDALVAAALRRETIYDAMPIGKGRPALAIAGGPEV